jgi:polar amino acid transport system permease protein
MTDLAVEQLGEGGDALPELYRSGRAKQRRSRAFRLGAYALGILLIVVVVLAADWARISDKFLDAERAKEMFPEVITIAAKNTILYTALSFIGGVVIGLTMALLRLSSIRAYRWFSAIYIEIFRGFPALLTIFLVGFITPVALGINFPKVLGVSTAGITALSLVAGAYLAETIRAGIEAVPKGQTEAAAALGLTRMQVFRLIILPQATRTVLPPLGNDLVSMIKDSALVSALGVQDLTQLGKVYSSSTFLFFETYNVVAFLYLVMTIGLSLLVRGLERHMAKSDAR